MKTRSLLAFGLLLLVFASGCEILGANDGEALVTTGVFVANQGNFGDGNGTITAYDPKAQGAASIDGFGSIIQSLYLHEDRLYVMANTGGRVDVLDATSLARVGQVEGLVSPRYMAVAGGKAYVTNLFGAAGSFSGGKVSVIDLETLAVVADVQVGDNPEGVIAVDGRVYVANHGFGGGNTVSVIDAETDAVVQTLALDCDGPRTLLADGDDEVWVFCTGRTLYDAEFNVIGETDGAVIILDGETGETVKRLAVEGRISTHGPGQDAFYSEAPEEAFAVRGADTILHFDTRRNAFVREVSPGLDAPIGALAFDAATDQFYVGLVKGFTEGGEVRVLDEAGAEVGRFEAGVAPTFITLRQRVEAR